MRLVKSFINLAILTGCVSLAGCNQNTSSPAGATAKTSPEQANAAEEAIDIGDWLPAPELFGAERQKMYLQLIRLVRNGDADAASSLAMESQQIASQLMQQDDSETAYRFFVQAGRAMRQAQAAEATEFPDPALTGQIYYNEACGLAKFGQLDKALVALEDAFRNGFSDLKLLDSDQDLVDVRQAEGYDAKREQWQELALERVRQSAIQDLQQGESFAFALDATDIEGNPHSLEELKGKVVIVDVWGTWCPPCRAEVPSFIKLQETYGAQGFQMLGLNYEGLATPEEEQKKVAEFVEAQGINYPCILGNEETQAQIPNFRGYPTTIFIDRTGKVRMQAVGLHEYEYLEAIVSTLLNEGSAG